MKPALPPLTWRLARSEDAPVMTQIYNESVASGGISPALSDASENGMAYLLLEGRRNGWPTWVLTHGEELIGWASLRRIGWGGPACGAVADLWLYVAKSWHGSGVAMQMARRVHPEIVPRGFDTLTCWILGGNRRSLSLVRGCRLKRWAVLPGVVQFGDRRSDVEIWGVRADDPQWQDYMTRLDARYRRLEARKALRGDAVADADADAVAGAEVETTAGDEAETAVGAEFLPSDVHPDAAVPCAA